MVPLAHAQISLPVTFEEPIDYELVDFGGNASMLAPDPADPANTVVETLRTVGAECFAGTVVADSSGFGAIPFTADSTTMNVRVWAPAAGIPVRLKVEQVGDPTVSVEAEVLTTVGGAWETLVYDFDNEVPGTAALNLASTYNKAAIFFDFQCPGDPSTTAATYYWDDLAFGGDAPPPPMSDISLPVTFEEPIDYELVDFGGNASMLAPDPADSTNTVVETLRTLGAECFAGTTVANASGFASPIPFAPGETFMNVRVWSPTAGTPVRLKVEEVGDPTVSVEAEVLTTVAGAWETLVYDFDNEVPGTAALNFASTYNKASIFFDFSCPGPPSTTAATYYWDDLAFGDIPDDIEADLAPTGATSIPFTGGTLGYSVTLTNTTGVSQTFSARIDATLPDGSPFGPVQGPRTVTLAPGQTIGPVSFSRNVPAVAPEGDYTLVLELSMGGMTINSDAFSFTKEGEPSGISLPVTFEEPIDYELVDFGGNASMLAPDPADSTNTVVETLRTIGAECFAGTTVARFSGFASPIPFAPGETFMNVRVWAPAAGIPVRLKVEKVDDPTVSVEAEVLTTVGGAWETLVYDFDNEVPGTAALNFASTYNIASIFFDFQCPGDPSTTAATYYWDDLAFGSSPVAPPPSASSRALTVDAAYPNPFAGRTTIPFAVDAPMEVRLAVYDLLGREVAVLVDGAVQAGRHEASLDARGLASGVYVWRLTTGDQTETGRLTLTR